MLGSLCLFSAARWAVGVPTTRRSRARRAPHDVVDVVVWATKRSRLKRNGRQARADGTLAQAFAQLLREQKLSIDKRLRLLVRTSAPSASREDKRALAGRSGGAVLDNFRL